MIKNEQVDDLRERYIDGNDCPICDYSCPDYFEGLLRVHWNKPDLLFQDILEALKNGSAFWVWGHLNRLVEIEGRSERIKKITEQVSRQSTTSRDEHDSHRHG